jgi:hypothetical protein
VNSLSRFFIPIVYTDGPKTLSDFLLEKVDRYFYLGGKKAYVIQKFSKSGQQKCVLGESDCTSLEKVAKLASCASIVIPVFMLIARVCLHLFYRFKYVDPRQKIEKNMENVDQIVDKVKFLLPSILKLDKKVQVEYIRGSKIFALEEQPEFVFKIGLSPNDMTLHKGKRVMREEARFDEMIKAKEVCLIHNLGLLVIPQARKFEFNYENQRCAMIIEKRLPIKKTESAQIEDYHEYSGTLTNAISQLMCLIDKTGLSDIKPANVPIINEPEELGDRHIALVDVEGMDIDSRIRGFYGLIKTVGENHIDLVVKEAREKGIEIKEEDKKERLQQIEKEKTLKQYYANNGITGKKLFQVKFDNIDLDLDQVGQLKVTVKGEDGKPKTERPNVTMREALEKFVQEINRLMQENSDENSLIGKRRVLINCSENPVFSQFIIRDKSKNKETYWCRTIINALVAGKYIQFDRSRGCYGDIYHIL